MWCCSAAAQAGQAWLCHLARPQPLHAVRPPWRRGGRGGGNMLVCCRLQSSVSAAGGGCSAGRPAVSAPAATLENVVQERLHRCWAGRHAWNKMAGCSTEAAAYAPACTQPASWTLLLHPRLATACTRQVSCREGHLPRSCRWCRPCCTSARQRCWLGQPAALQPAARDPHLQLD